MDFGGSAMTLFLLIMIMLIACVYFFQLSMKQPYLVKLAWRNIIKNKSRSVLLVIGATIGTTLMTSTFLLNSFIDKNIERVVSSHFGPITIDLQATHQPHLRGEYFTHKDVQKVQQDYSKTQEKVQTLPIVALTTNLIVKGEREQDADFKYMFVFGLEEDHSKLLGTEELQNKYLELQPNEILLSEKVAKQMEARSGSIITILDKAHRPHSFLVKEVFPEETWLGYRGVDMVLTNALVHIESARALTDIPPNQYSNVLILESTTAFSSDYSLDIEIAQYETFHMGWREMQVKKFAEWMLQEFYSVVQMFSLGSIIAGVMGIILILNIFLMITEERKGELNILRSIGISKKKITSLLLLEGAFYALVSAFLGSILGLFLANIIIYFLTRLINEILQVWEIAFDEGFHINLFSISYGMALGSALILICMWLVSRQVAKQTFIINEQPVRSISLKKNKSKKGFMHIVIVFSGALSVSLFLISLLVDFHLSLDPVKSLLIYFLIGLLLMLALSVFSSLMLPSILEWLSLRKKLSPTIVAQQIWLSRHIMHNKGRTILYMLMFAGVFLVTSTSNMFSKNTLYLMNEVENDLYKANVLSFSQSLHHHTLSTDRIMEMVEEKDAVKSISSSIETFLPQHLATLKGMNQENNYSFKLYKRSPRFKSDEEVGLELKTNPDVVVISYGHEYVENKQYEVGEMFPMKIGKLIVEKEIIGIETSGPLYENFMIWINEDELQNIVQDKRVMKETYFLQFENEEALNKNKEFLEKQLVYENVTPLLNLKTRKDLVYDSNRMIYRLFEYFNVFSICIGIVGLMIVTLRSIQERRYEFGLFRVIGINSKFIYSHILFEGMLIGISGMTVGVFIGWNTGYTMLKPQFYDIYLREYDGMLFPAPSLLFYYLGAVLLVIVSLWVMAHRSFKVTPMEGTKLHSTIR